MSGEFDDLIHNGNAPDGGQALVEILDTDYAFKSDGCSNWVPKDQPFGLDGTIPSGNWLVGVDIEPGTYRATGESFGCYYERLADLQGFEGLIANGNAPDGGSAVVEIADTDYAFSTDGCTAWEKINE